MDKLGLMKIKKTLPQIVETLKKKLLNILIDAGIKLPKTMSISNNLHSVSGMILRRRSAVALVNQGYAVNAVATLVGCCLSTVVRSLQRMANTGDVIDLRRSGCPATYSETFKLELIGFYCQTQPFINSGRWTLRWAATHLAAHPKTVKATPSKSTIHRVLKENNLKPHQSRYFLHITDPDFFPKMDHLIELYSKPPKNLFFFDECPGIQMLKRLVPNLRTEKAMKLLEEFEYIRNGTMNVLAFYNHANGQIYAECQADHKTDTFLGVFRRQVASCHTKEQIHYVMDNLSTHRGYPFCKAVAELSNIACPPETELNILEKRVEWLKSTDKRIVIHYTPFHGSWLNLVEFWFGIMNQHVLNSCYGSAKEIKDALEAFFIEWNTLHAHPFKWSYDGKQLHQKAVARFTEMLKQAASILEISTLTKQMCLMINLFDHYFDEVQENNWEKLFDVLQSQKEVLGNSIMNEEGPKKKKKAENALNSLMAILQDYTDQNFKEVA